MILRTQNNSVARLSLEISFVIKKKKTDSTDYMRAFNGFLLKDTKLIKGSKTEVEIND